MLLNLERIKNILLVAICILVILYFGKALFIPLSFAILISFLLYPVCAWLERHKFKRAIAVFICISILVIIICVISAVLFQQVIAFSHDWPALKAKLPDAVSQIKGLMSESLGISFEQQKKWIDYFSNNSSTEFLSFISSVLYSSGLIAVGIILIPFFAALILLNRSTLLSVLYGLFPPGRAEVVHKVLHLSVKAYYDFIKGMIVVYMIVGILNSIGLWILGIPHPILFGCIASILTFIPFIGIIIGSLLPIAVSWLTYNSIMYPLGVILIFTIVQYLEANLIFPLAVSNRLKISSLATLISIIAGGIIWGAAGMILFVPFIAITKLIADNSPNLKPLSLLLGK